LWRVVEQRNELRLALVAHLEGLLLQRGDEAAISVRHSNEDPHGVTDTTKNRRRLLRGNHSKADGTYCKDAARENPIHATCSFIFI
jgi:hypothetical protein